MRRFFVSLCIFGCLMAMPTSALAQRAFSNNELNDRIKALRSRLQNYQLKTARKTIDKTPVERETVEVKSENILEELDNRKDANLTVLFHDSEFFADQENSGSRNEQPDAVLLREEEAKKRDEKFAALRAKVKMATRRARENAKEINSMVAQLP